MAFLENFFVPREEIVKLTKGSFEQLAVRLETTLASETKRLFGGKEAQVLATFAESIVVVTDDGLVHRVGYETQPDGTLQLTQASPVEASIVKRSEMPSFLRKESLRVADLFLKGSLDEAQRRLQQLVSHVNEATPIDDDGVVDGFQRVIRSSTLWKKFVEQNESVFAKALAESAAVDSEQKLRPKFSKLYDGSETGTALEQYRASVDEALKGADGRLVSVLQLAVESVQQLREHSEKSTVQQNAHIQTLGSFVNDFVKDVRAVRSALAESIEGITAVSALGKLFDVLAEELSRYESAGAVLAELTRRLESAE